MPEIPTKTALLATLIFFGWTPLLCAQTSAAHEPSALEKAKALVLSPFVVQEADQGYYASQTLAGGRMRQDIKDLGASIQVVTKAFMEDLGVTGVEELFQYTTSTEVGGILGNFTGALDSSVGNVSNEDARMNPDATTRVRGLAAPDRARNFFKTDIPWDSYNTDRVDINRGANSFLFGLGSPAGLTNTGMTKAGFKDTNEVTTRIGSGGKTPSYRGSFGLNRVLIKETLAIYIASLMDRTKYRQEPTYKNDDRQYVAASYRPFKNSNTVITAHVENGRIRGTAPDILLPLQNLNVFLDDPVVGRVSIAAYSNLQRFGNSEGPSQAQFNALSPADKLKYRVRDFPTPLSLANSNSANGAYSLIYDGTNGRLPGFAYTDFYRANEYTAGDRFFAPGRATGGAPISIYHGNLRGINGTGWLDQGFTNLKTFDFSRTNLGWDNDFYGRDFVNYNVALEQVFWKGRAGFELAYDYQDLFRREYVAFGNSTVGSEVKIDINETLWLPTDPNYRTSGIVAPRPNPNYGRPFIMTRTFSRLNDSQREAARFTGFVKYDFAERLKRGSWLGKLLGSHTFTGLADTSTFDEKAVTFQLSSFGDPEPALHIGPATARAANNIARNVPRFAYIGPPQLNAFTDPNFKITNFTLTPAKYQLRPASDYSIQKLSWNLGPDATAATFGLDSRANGNEGFVLGTFNPREVPTPSSRLQRTKITSYVLNSQSFFWEHLLVVNAGYREDTVKSWLNNQPPQIGLDEIPDVSPAAWRIENGTYSRIKSRVFGYGGVLNWPKAWIRLPAGIDAAVHYNRSENFAPALDRVDQYRHPVASPTGLSKDYGFTVSFWESKVVARFNWFTSTLAGADSGVSGNFNQTNNSIFTTYGYLNRDIMRLDANNDGQIDDAIRNQIAINPATGLTPEGLTRDAALRLMYPNFGRLAGARDALAPTLTDALKQAYIYRMLADGTSATGSVPNITDTADIESRGFEAEIVLNPTRNWRIAFNATRQETINTNIAPALTALIRDTWLPFLAKYGDMDNDAPAEVVSGNTIAQGVNGPLLTYFAAKAQEGRPQAEQRKWRANVVSRYLFSEGRLKGFSFGGAARWEDRFAAGYPIINDPRGLILPDIAHPYLVGTEMSFDLTIGYRRRILGNKDWTAQLNVRNLQNLHSDTVSVVRYQPDGTAARVRFDPPLQVFLTNTVRF